MIKLKKTYPIPNVLNILRSCKLTSETNSNNLLYDSNPNNYVSQLSKFIFDSDIYGHTNIKTSLILSQNGKCAFCEQNVVGTSYGDVEHFRPKGGYKQYENDSLCIPGYYWLAYNWDNLLFSCGICNQRFKKNLFPILNQTKRAINHHVDLKYEKPILINPYFENPKYLIGYNQEIACGKDKKGRGKKTIEILGLNRDDNGISDLLEIRKDYFDTVEQIYITSKKTADHQTSQAQIDKSIELMKKYRSKNKQFSAMINDNFPI